MATIASVLYTTKKLSHLRHGKWETYSEEKDKTTQTIEGWAGLREFITAILKDSDWTVKNGNLSQMRTSRMSGRGCTFFDTMCFFCEGKKVDVTELVAQIQRGHDITNVRRTPDAISL